MRGTKSTRTMQRPAGGEQLGREELEAGERRRLEDILRKRFAGRGQERPEDKVGVVIDGTCSVIVSGDGEGS